MPYSKRTMVAQVPMHDMALQIDLYNRAKQNSQSFARVLLLQLELAEYQNLPLTCCNIMRSWTAKAFKRSAMPEAACLWHASHVECA